MKEKMGSIFWSGVKVLVPLALLIGIVVWLVTAIDSFFGYFIKLIIGAQHYVVGMGFIAGIILVFLVGWAVNQWLIAKFHQLGEKILKKIPGIRWLYESLQELMAFFDPSKPKPKEGRVVTVQVGDKRMFGLVTREEFGDLPEGFTLNDDVAVYIPMSYNIGGFTVIVPRSDIQAVKMPADKMLKFVMTAGMTRKQDA